MFQWVLCGPNAACATLSHMFCYFTSLLCGRTHRHILFGLILASFLKVHTSSRSLKSSGSLCLREEDGLQHLDLLSFRVLTQRSRQLRAGNHPYTSMSLPVLLRPVPLSLSVTVSHNLESITFWVHPHQKPQPPDPPQSCDELVQTEEQHLISCKNKLYRLFETTCGHTNDQDLPPFYRMFQYIQ